MANPGAYAVVRGEEPQVFLAEDANVLSRVLALRLVAQLAPTEVSNAGRLKDMQDALLDERWGAALVLYMEETGVTIDVYDEAPEVWTEARLDADQASMEIRMSPLFADPPGPPGR